MQAKTSFGKRIIIWIHPIIITCLLIVFKSNSFSQTITVDLIELKKLGASDSLITLVVQRSQSDAGFDISEIIKLKKSGISEKVIITLLQKHNNLVLSAEVTAKINELESKGIPVDKGSIVELTKSGISDETILLMLKKQDTSDPKRRISRKKSVPNNTPTKAKTSRSSPPQTRDKNSEHTNSSGHSFGLKGSVGYRPSWNVGLSYFSESSFGFEALFSTAGNSSFIDAWNDRYGDSANASGFLFEGNLFFVLTGSRVNQTESSKFGFSLGGGISYLSVKGQSPGLGGEGTGNVYGFNLLLNVLHKIQENILLEYRIGYRFFGEMEVEFKSDEVNAKANFPGDELNTITLSAGIHILL